MGNIIDYVNARGSFVLFDPPMIEYRAHIETPYNTFWFSYVPDRFRASAAQLVEAWRKIAGRHITWPTIRKNLYYLPLENNQVFVEQTSKLTKSFTKFSRMVTKRWDEYAAEAQDALVDYMRTTWQRSPIQDECTLGEYIEAGLKAIKVKQANGPVLRQLRFMYFHFGSTVHTEPQISGYTGVPAMLWRWFQDVAESTGNHLLARLRRYVGLLPRYESASALEWQTFAQRHNWNKDRLDGYLPSFRLIGKTEVVEIIEDLDQGFADFYVAWEDGLVTKGHLAGRDMFVPALRRIKSRIKELESALEDHVDLYRLVENG